MGDSLGIRLLVNWASPFQAGHGGFIPGTLKGLDAYSTGNLKTYFLISAETKIKAR